MGMSNRFNRSWWREFTWMERSEFHLSFHCSMFSSPVLLTEWEEKNKNLWNTSSNTRKDLCLILIRFLLAWNWICAEFWNETLSLKQKCYRKVLQNLTPVILSAWEIAQWFFCERCRFPLLELFSGGGNRKK